MESLWYSVDIEVGYVGSGSLVVALVTAVLKPGGGSENGVKFC
jgi:hypothetical protein